ncbi:MAG: hypothetical protein K5644_08405, partial [Lachnospiraceae bacterium]|nr:hypothetical protein [Lachnospiraceae bacterium]
MKKYASYGKKILACLLAVAVVLTTASVDMKVLAAAFSDAPNESIPTGGYIGQITTNGKTTNQQVNTISFKIAKVASVSYTYTVDIYENPTDASDPTSGELRKSIEGSIESSTSQTAEQIDVSVGNDDSDKPIVLTKGESLGVSINILGYSNDPIYFYDSDEGTGFTKESASSGWVDRTEGTMLIQTSTYNGALSDVESITMAPESTVLSVGDSAVDLNISLSPNYKRDITVTSSNSNVVSINSTQQAVMSGSGTATVTASAAGASTTANFYVLQPTINTDTETYKGSPITKSISVVCGSTTLTEDTD